MSIEVIHLRKILKILYSTPAQRTSALRSDIREDIARDGGGTISGGDFYGPFWRDAKDHVFGFGDLHDATEHRIESNPRRENLYPQLRDGFLLWWNERRRWTNEPFHQLDAPKGRHIFADIGATVKVDNLLAVRDGRNADHFVYPYFSPTPPLGDEPGRLGLWLLREALPRINPDDLRVLDVIRGQTFAIERNPLQGDEGDVFAARYRAALNEWRRLWSEYE